MASSVSCGVPLWVDGPSNASAGNLRPYGIAGTFLSLGTAAVRGGVLPGGGALKVTAGSGMKVTVATGFAVCPSSAGSVGGGYLFGHMQQDSLDVAASDPSNPRIDLVCAYVDDLGNSSSAAYVEVVEGSPAPSPAAPAAPSNSITLAQILVPAGSSSVTSGNITDQRQYTVTHGSVLPVSLGQNNGVEGLPASPYTGLLGYDMDSGRMLDLSSGSAKQPAALPWSPVIKAKTNPFALGSSPEIVHSISVTVDGSTDLEIYCSWPYVGGAANQLVSNSIEIDGTAVDGWYIVTDAASQSQGGSYRHYTSSVTGDTPSAGTHTITWVSTGTGGMQIVGGPGGPITMRVAPVCL